MASSENVSFVDQSASMSKLAVKPNQNLIIDLDASCYNALIRPLIECLKFSPLMKALTMSEDVPLVHLSKDLSTAVYNKYEYVINFEVSSHKTSITKPNFYKLLGLVKPAVSVDPESIPAAYLIEMFFQIGYTGDISLFSKFRKSFLPLIWNGFFTLLFKSLSKRVSGSNSASKLFYTLIYRLYHGINLDFRFVIWDQFVQSTSSSTRHIQISCACFWSIIMNRALIHRVPRMQDSLMAEILMLHTTIFVMSDPRSFEFIGSILAALLEKVPLDNSIIRSCRKMSCSGVLPIHAELKNIIDEGDKLTCGGKRKAKTAPSVGIKVTKKSKKPVPKPRSPSPVLQDQSKEQTKSDVQGTTILQNDEEDTAHTSELTHVETIHKVSSPPPSSIPTSEIFDSIITSEPHHSIASTIITNSNLTYHLINSDIIHPSFTTNELC